MLFDFDVIRDFINKQSPQTRIYIGVDSERVKIDDAWHAIYTAAIVVHVDGNHGCKLFGEVSRERDYGPVDRPSTRLMTEVFKVSDLYQKLADVLVDRPVEVHLDLNPDEYHVSNSVVQQALGYIRGTCNVIPLVKPRAFAATYAADRMRVLKIANG